MLTSGFIVAHSHKLEDLTELVLALSRRYPLPPLTTEMVLVQSNGMAQWLKQAMAEQLGIATLLELCLPSRFVWQAYRAVLGNDIPQYSPFDKANLIWRIFRLLPQCLLLPEFTPLRHYVAQDADLRKSYQLSERLADVFDQYQIYRTDWLSDWAVGGRIQADDDNLWQPVLWRHLLADVGADADHLNRATLQQHFIRRAGELNATQRPDAIPPRIIVFGISTLPQQVLEVLDALKGCCQIILCVNNPCRYHWADIVDGKAVMQQLVHHSPRMRYKKGMSAEQDELSLHAAAHPLLASWGKQGRDYIRLLDKFDETRQKASHFNELAFELFDTAPATTLLGQLQQDILELRSIAETRQQWQCRLLQQDQSIQFHIAHSPLREVEILHDQLLAAFAADNSLRPRDIMIMVPDINLYAPYIRAVFGRFARTDKRYIPFTLADQGSRQHEPILIALDAILHAPQQRFSMTEVLDLIQVPAIAARFGITEQDFPLLQYWCREAGIRWGLDAAQRQSLGITALEQNSWRFGLRRMLMGYMTGSIAEPAESGLWQQTEPLTQVKGLQAAVAGALFQFIELLEDYWQQFQQARSPQQWGECFQQLLPQLLLANTDAEKQLLATLSASITAWTDSCREAAFDAAIPLTIAREAWLGKLDEHRLSQPFISGAVNFSTLMPMRAIPFQYVCLLGMNDGAYPRSVKPLEFDLMAKQYRPGDRSRREDDRYLFLEALLSARQKLYISWVGRSVRDNSARPPSVLVSQLREHLVMGWMAEGKNASDWLAQLTTEHYLQPFNLAYFQTGNSRDRYFSYASEWLQVHQQATAKTGFTPLAGWLPENPLTITQLAAFLQQPASSFFNLRLQIWFSKPEQPTVDEELFALTGLNRWQLQSELLQTLQHNLPDTTAPEDAVSDVLQQKLLRLQRSGQLAPAVAGELMQQQLLDSTLQCYQRFRQLSEGYSAVGKIRLSYYLPGADNDIGVEDYCEGLYQLTPDDTFGIRRYLRFSASNKPEISLSREISQLWISHLLLNRQQATDSYLVAASAALHFSSLTPEESQQLLDTLLHYFKIGLTYPLPLESGTALCWLQRRDKPDALSSAARLYDNDNFNQSARVKTAAYCGRVYADFQALSASEEFFQLAELLYSPLLQKMEILSGEPL